MEGIPAWEWIVGFVIFLLGIMYFRSEKESLYYSVFWSFFVAVFWIGVAEKFIR